MLVANLLPMLRGDYEVIKNATDERGRLTASRLRVYWEENWKTANLYYQGDYTFENLHTSAASGFIIGQYSRPVEQHDSAAPDVQNPEFDASFYVNTFIRQYKQGRLPDEKPIVEPLARSKLFNIFVPLGYENEQGQYFDSLDEFVQEWLVDDRRHYLALLGEYGSGKTAYCLSLCYHLLCQYCSGSNTDELSVLPIYLSFRDIVPKTSKDSTERRIFNILANNYKIKIGTFKEFRSALRKRKVLLILDGFDEIVSSLDIEAIKLRFLTLEDILSACHKVIITCRVNYFYSEGDVKYVLPSFRSIDPLSLRNIDLLDSVISSHKAGSEHKFELLHLSDFDPGRQEKYLQNTIEDEQRRKDLLRTI